VSRTLFSIALIACAFLLVGTARGNHVDDFLQAMQQDIDSGNVNQAGALYSQSVPQELLNYPHIWGWTYWPGPDSAPCTWVRATAVDSPAIAAWAHTSWPTGGYPHSNCYYVFDTYTPQPIKYNHSYYIKGLHWLPRTVYDYPSESQSGPIPPPAAQGEVNSPTYSTQVWHNYDIIQCDVCLNGPPAMW
jgi:hypothetical protein